MAMIKICPQCLLITDGEQFSTQLIQCPICSFDLKQTDIPLDKYSKEHRKLRLSYKDNPNYNEEAAKTRIKWELVASGVYTKEELFPASPPTLNTCPVCQGKVSSAAPACPHCGQPMSNGQISTPSQSKKEELRDQLFTKDVSQPRCPTCGSKNIEKIGTFDRLTSIGVFGLGSSKFGKTMKCNACKYKW